MAHLPELALIIPVFNEEQRIAKTFNALRDFLKHAKISRLDIVFVDDGSRDGTVRAIQQFQGECSSVRLISYPDNRGKGFVVRKGMLAASAPYRLILDADMSTPLTEFEKFIPFLEKGCPVVIGTRKGRGAIVAKPQAWYRRKLGEGYTILANLVTGVKVSDFTCGFKCFTGYAADAIFSRASIDRWSFDAEILFLARAGGFQICEVPVVWRNDADSRVRLTKDLLKSFVDLFRIRFRRGRKPLV